MIHLEPDQNLISTSEAYSIVPVQRSISNGVPLLSTIVFSMLEESGVGLTLPPVKESVRRSFINGTGRLGSWMTQDTRQE